MSTESRNPRSYGLDKMSAQEIVRLMDEEERNALRAVEQAEKEIAVAAEKAAEAFKKGGRIFYVGAGTSGRIATMDAAEMPPTFGIDPNIFIPLIAGGANAGNVAVEDAEDDVDSAVLDLNRLKLTTDDILIGLAASGTTPYVVSAVKHASQKGVWTCGIANNANTPLLIESDLGIFLHTGPEILTGSTRLKAGTSQKLILNRISTIAMVLSGKVVENLMIDVKAKNAKLRERCIRIVCSLSNATQEEAQDILEANNWSIRFALDATKSAATR